MKIYSTLLEIIEQLNKTITFLTLQHLKISNTFKQVKYSLQVGVQTVTMTLENNFGMFSKFENIWWSSNSAFQDI